MTVTRSTPTTLTTRAGSFEVVTLGLTREGASAPALEYSFEVAPPHRLIQFVGGDGTRYQLSKVERLAYWNLNRPGDQVWWPASP